MKALFADTSYFIALLDQNESMHRRAISHLLSGAEMVTTEFVLIELGNAMSRGEDHVEFGAIVHSLRASPKVRLVPLSSEYFELGLKLMLARTDKEWSLVDCVSMEVMRQLEIEEALTTDKHFKQAGFRALLR